MERADEIFSPRVDELREERGQFFTDNQSKRGGGTIHIKPENIGAFTAAAHAMGHSVQEHARHTLASKFRKKHGGRIKEGKQGLSY